MKNPQSSPIITQKLGRPIPSGIGVSAHALILLCLTWGIMYQEVKYVWPALIGVLFASIFDGIRLNPASGKYKEYVTILGIRFGKWKSYKNYPYLSILRSQKKTALRWGGYEQTGKYSEVEYEIYLLNKTHLRRIMVGTYDDEDKANKKAQELAGALGMEMVRYNPAGSKRIRRR